MKLSHNLFSSCIIYPSNSTQVFLNARKTYTMKKNEIEKKRKAEQNVLSTRVNIY
jgi:hypothetical protein